MDNKFKFHSFDALRFFSFLFVFLSHLPYKFFPKNPLTILDERGRIGVYYFFTLSGFLITYILLSEKTATNQINFKNFMIRRILRIWPLFYLMILFAFCSSYLITYLNISSLDLGYEPNWLISCLFLENYSIIWHNQSPNFASLGVMWSLCVEEHFYIIKGSILFFIKIKHIPYTIVLLLILSSVSKYIFLIYNLGFHEILTNLDFFMFGAIPAYLFVTNNKKTILFVDSISNKLKVFFILITLFVVFFSYLFKFSVLFEQLLYGFLFSGILFIFLPQENRFIISNNNIFSKLGVYTYGLYLIHIISISALKQFFIKFSIPFEGNFIIFTLGSFIITIFASYLTFHYFESPFLRLKKYFQ